MSALGFGNVRSLNPQPVPLLRCGGGANCCVIRYYVKGRVMRWASATKWS